MKESDCDCGFRDCFGINLGDFSLVKDANRDAIFFENSRDGARNSRVAKW